MRNLLLLYLLLFGSAQGQLLVVQPTEETSPGTVQFASSTYSVQEDNLTVTIQVDRLGGSDGQITVDVADTEGTATEPEDYTNPDQTLTFPNGVTSQTFDLTVEDDASSEGNETLTIGLSGVTGGGSIGTPSSTTVTIQDPAAAPSVTLTVNDPAMVPGHNEILFTVRIATAESENVPFDYATSNAGTGDAYAAAGTDYTATSGSSFIPAGQTYKQIAVPIAGNIPPLGMHIFTFTVTDSELNEASGTGRIVNADYLTSYDYPSATTNPPENWFQNDRTGVWLHNDIEVTTSRSVIGSSIPCKMGVRCLRHDMVVTDGTQGTWGLEGGSTHRMGDIFDGLEYYFLVYMLIEPGFDWDGLNQDKMKAGRFVRIIGQPNYTTAYIQGDRWYWPRSYPAAGNSHLNLFYDFDSMDDGLWHEVIVYHKRETAYEAGDGEARLVVDCVLEDTELNTNWTEPGKTEPGNASSDDVRVTNLGMFTWFQNQIGDPGETTGGIIYTDGQMSTPFWPSVDCARPW